MKLPYSLIMLLTSCFGINKEIKTRPEGIQVNHAQGSSFYDFKVSTLEGDTVDFSIYRGKKVLIVNTASKCGYTPQYADLQKLSDQYGDKLHVLGFPCDQFGKQEPGDNQEIKQFCERNYGVTFQMFDKVNVKGADKHPLYEWLTNKDKNGWNSQAPSWNFCKYLINEKGELIKFYSSSVSPLSKEVIEAIGS